MAFLSSSINDQRGETGLTTLSVGVCAPIYGGLQYLPDFITSLLGQTRLPDQVSLVDNGNSSPISDYLESIRPDFHRKGIELRITRLPINIGSTLGYNLAVSQLTTDIVVLTSSDDILVDSRIERAISSHENGHSFVHSAFKYFGERSNILKSTGNIFDLHLRMLFENSIGAVTVSLDTRAIPKGEIAFFQHRQGADDYALWCHLLSRGVVPHYINEVLMNYRIHSQQVSSRFDYSKSNVLSLIQKEWFNSLFGQTAIIYSPIIMRVANALVNSHPVRAHLSDSRVVKTIKKILEDHARVAPESISRTAQRISDVFEN